VCPCVQARGKAGSLEIVGKVLPDDDDDLSVPTDELGGDEELVGTDDTEELVLAELGEGPEEVGLDVELGADERSESVTLDLLDADEEEGTRWALDDALADVDEELDVADEEGGWTADSEGLGGVWDDEVGIDDDEENADDGGLEGVDDPLLDQLDLDALENAPLEQDDVDLEDESRDGEGDLGDELPPGLSASAPVRLPPRGPASVPAPRRAVL
jgi:hypothetical protein